MIDLNHPVFVAYLSPQAEWKRALLIELGRRFNLPTLIETGTYLGDTVGAARSHFTDIWSVELSPTLHASATRRFANNPDVHLICGSSGEELPAIVAQTTGPLLFWLDAHITGGQSAGNGDQIARELDVIQSMRPNSLVLIDDVKPGAHGGFDAPDAPIAIPDGWQTHFLSGVLVLHAGSYVIPETW